VELEWNDTDKEKLKYSEKNMFQCHFFHHKFCFAVSTHPRHQPAATWVNITRYYKHSQVLLVMGEIIARNM